MTRIIGGIAGSTRLEVPRSGTRPTSDRVRESLFAALESADVVEGAKALDLYAGSGALGLEALSRGAVSADLVEQSKSAAAIVRGNIIRVEKSLGIRGVAKVHTSSVSSFLAQPRGPFDLVFLDPPYDLADAALTSDLTALAPRLSAAAIVVVERAARAAPPDFAVAGMRALRERSYGSTTLWWGEPEPGRS